MSKAVYYVAHMNAGGGTELLRGIQESMKKFSKKRNVAKLLFLLTDGAPNNPWNYIHGEFERLNYVRFYIQGSVFPIRNRLFMNQV